MKKKRLFVQQEKVCIYCKSSFLTKGLCQRACQSCKKHVDNVAAQVTRDVKRYKETGSYDYRDVYRSKKNELGAVYGNLTVIEDAGSDITGHALWLCSCECGGERVTTGLELRRGSSFDCINCRGNHFPSMNQRDKASYSSFKRSIQYYYSLSEEEFVAMQDHQKGCCKICGGTLVPGTRDQSVDHNHHTGIVRGLLCKMCNTGLGMLGDNPVIVKAALDYLESEGHYSKRKEE